MDEVVSLEGDEDLDAVFEQYGCETVEELVASGEPTTDDEDSGALPAPAALFEDLSDAFDDPGQGDPDRTDRSDGSRQRRAATVGAEIDDVAIDSVTIVDGSFDLAGTEDDRERSDADPAIVAAVLGGEDPSTWRTDDVEIDERFCYTD